MRSCPHKKQIIGDDELAHRHARVDEREGGRGDGCRELGPEYYQMTRLDGPPFPVRCSSNSRSTSAEVQHSISDFCETSDQKTAIPNFFLPEYHHCQKYILVRKKCNVQICESWPHIRPSRLRAVCRNSSDNRIYSEKVAERCTNTEGLTTSGNQN